MNSLFNMIVSAIKNRFVAITSKVRYWTNASFIKVHIINRFRQWLSGLFNVKPRNKKDYYAFFGLLVSKRLVHLVVICIGLICLGYLWVTKPFKTAAQDEKIKVYAYNSLPLKFINDKVSITAKKGYIAYTGQVKGGHAEGEGELYNEAGGLVYTGEFSKNEYNGTGTSYYSSGQIQYEGEFKNNLYQGSGNLYRSSGTLYYAGQFAEGYMDGTGELYDKTGTKVFTGQFRRGELEYIQLLDKTTQEINAMYTGSQKLYAEEEQSMVALENISALYTVQGADSSIEEENTSSAVYVMRDRFVYGEKQLSTVNELQEALGEPLYEGNSYVTYYDAVAIQWGQANGNDIDIDAELEYIEEYDEYTSVTGYNKEALLYMYVYEIDDLNYTFVSEGRNGGFFMYIISK